MYKGFKVIDADSHMMEPDEIWDKYVDPEFRPWGPSGPYGKPSHPDLATKGFSMTNGGLAYIHDGDGKLITYAEKYKPYIERKFDAKAFLMYMDVASIDYMVLYPTQALGLTSRVKSRGLQLQSPKIAAALWRAYNNWVYDFCNKGEGRLFGSGGIDLRDADMAAKEVRRCVKELGLKAVFLLPQPALGIPLHDPYYDVLWAEIAEQGIPLGIHFSQGCTRIGQEYWGEWQLGRAATSFPIEYMMTCISMSGGGVLERHPNLKIIFLESGAGWVPFFLWWSDDKWHQGSGLSSRLTQQPPSYYFRRQCWVSGEPDEPGFDHLVRSGLENNLMTATDFPHPEDVHFPRVLDEFYKVQSQVLTDDQIRKVLWDNPARLYNIS